MAVQKKRPVTVNALGVSAKADPDGLDDYDLFEVISEYGAMSFEAFEAMGKALFGEGGWKDVKDGLREDGGKLKLSRVGEFIDEVATQLNALKN